MTTLIQPTHNEFCALAFALRSQPSWLRSETVAKWCFSTMLPREKPDDVNGCIEAMISVSQSIESTFDEWSGRWLQDSNGAHFCPLTTSI
jgi:hypothetical protein